MAGKKELGFNVFSNTSPMNRNSFFDFMMSKGEEFQDYMDTFEMMDMNARSEGYSDVDTYACDCLFLRAFPSSDMMRDFHEIANDFFAHEFANLKKYDQVEYVPEGKLFNHPAANYIGWTLNLMMNAAKQGNAYVIGLFQYLYQTYYKKEYKHLKRFRSISRSELIDIAEMKELADFFWSIPRLMTMCRIYGIELEPDCYMFYKMFPDYLERLLEKEEIPFFEGFPEDIIDEACDRIKSEMAEVKEDGDIFENKNYRVFVDNVFFLRAAEKWLDLPEGFVEECDSEFYSVDMQLIRAYEIMRTMDPNREYTFEEIQQKAVLLKTLSALACYHDYSTENFERILGVNYGKYECEQENSLFNPEKVKVPSSSSQTVRGSGITKEKKQAAIPTANVSVSKEESGSDLYEELEKLRTKLRRLDQDNQLLREKNKKLDLKLKESEAESEISKAEHEELVHLRNHVYQLTEVEENSTSVDLSQLETFLKEKKIVIIGGHSNWTNKLRNRFPKWVFFKPEISNTLDGRVLDDADYIYFFTDVLSHGTYGKYMKLIRSRGISDYGYIHSINIATNLRQIGEDLGLF